MPARPHPFADPQPPGDGERRHDHPLPLPRREFLKRSALAVAGATLFSCTGGRIVPKVEDVTPRSDTATPIKRVIYLMLENRSFNNLFGKFPGVRGTTVGVENGTEKPLIRCPEWLPGDLPHDLAAHRLSVNGGAMDGFGTGSYGSTYAYTIFDEDQIPNYWDWAREYSLSENFFASAAGPSYPNHYYFVAGSSGGVADNPENIRIGREDGKSFKSWGCDAVGDDVFVLVKDDKGNLTKHDTCFTFRTVPQQLEEIGVSWAYYSASPYQSGYFWNALNAIDGVFHTDLWRDETIRPVDRIVDDIREGELPAVTWVTPRFELSGHPPESTCYSQNWLGGIVNAVMQSDAWEHTALFVSWDMWGGLYDHTPPPVVDDIGYGYRVPAMVVSPYARRGYVDDGEADHCAPLKFIEDNWGLPYLTSRIERTHNFEHVFDFSRNPRTDARPVPTTDDCYGTPWEFPGEDYPGWPQETEPDESHFVQGGP
jgi:phospholipase C